MDLQDQLKNLFPDHEPLPRRKAEEVPHELYVQKNLWFVSSKKKRKATTNWRLWRKRQKILKS
jgi:translation initiation factor 1